MRLCETKAAPSEELSELLVSHETSPISEPTPLAKLLKRPHIGYADLAPFDPERPELPREVREQAEIRIKYEGYIKMQQEQVERMKKLEDRRLGDIDYSQIRGLRLEAAEKLAKVRPVSVGQAARISGVNPADISVLLIWLEQKRREGE